MPVRSARFIVSLVAPSYRSATVRCRAQPIFPRARIFSATAGGVKPISDPCRCGEFFDLVRSAVLHEAVASQRESPESAHLSAQLYPGNGIISRAAGHCDARAAITHRNVIQKQDLINIWVKQFGEIPTCSF